MSAATTSGGADFVDVVDGLAVRRLGTGPRLVALHGGPGLDHRVLLPLARRLATRFEVWLPDLPGHGGSVPPSGRLPGLRDVEHRLGAWLARHAPTPAVLVGHSLGAWLARELLRGSAGARRIRPSALVLLAPPAAGRSATRDDPAAASAVRLAFELSDRFRPTGTGSDAERARRAAVAEIRSHVRAESGGQVPDELERDLADCAARSPLAYRALVRNLHRRLAGPLRPFDPGCPTLVLCGTDDQTTPPQEAEHLARTSSARFETIAGVGHYLHAQRPDEVAARIVRFSEEGGADESSVRG